MENPEEILHSLEEFSKMKPKDIPRELEEYLCFVAKTGDPVYQWSTVKSLFREKLINVITEFYESCHNIEIPPCRNVEVFNYEIMKNFILEKLDTFVAAPFTVQRICELLTTPRKEYNRIDKYMRALEKNILVVSTTEPGGKRSESAAENGESIVNGIEYEHAPEPSTEINVEEMDDSPSWPRNLHAAHVAYENSKNEAHNQQENQNSSFDDLKIIPCTSSTEESIANSPDEDTRLFVTSPSENSDTQHENPDTAKESLSVTITAVSSSSSNSSDSVTSDSSENTELSEENKVVESKPEMTSEVTTSEERVEASSDASPEESKVEEIDKVETGIEDISPETSTSPDKSEADSSTKTEESPSAIEDQLSDEVSSDSVSEDTKGAGDSEDLKNDGNKETDEEDTGKTADEIVGTKTEDTVMTDEKVEEKSVEEDTVSEISKENFETEKESVVDAHTEMPESEKEAETIEENSGKETPMEVDSAQTTQSDKAEVTEESEVSQETSCSV